MAADYSYDEIFQRNIGVFTSEEQAKIKKLKICATKVILISTILLPPYLTYKVGDGILMLSPSHKKSMTIHYLINGFAYNRTMAITAAIIGTASIKPTEINVLTNKTFFASG